jgi:hypothetical protein
MKILKYENLDFFFLIFETKNPRKRFTLPVHSLKNYGPLNSQTTGKVEQ